MHRPARMYADKTSLAQHHSAAVCSRDVSLGQLLLAMQDNLSQTLALIQAGPLATAEPSATVQERC